MSNTATVTDKIALKNDAHRKHSYQFYFTVGAQQADMLKLTKLVIDFDTFTEDNDPYGEHDFGSVELEGVKYFWKIDYYDEQLEKWSDPLDDRTRRILTIMRADEY